MLGTVLTRLHQKVTSLISNVTTLTQQLLFKITGVLTAIKTRFVASLTSLSFLLVQTTQNINRLRVSLIIVEQSIKAVLTIVRLKATQIGLLLLTTVRQTLQLVRQVLLQSKDRLVALIKSER